MPPSSDLSVFETVKKLVFPCIQLVTCLLIDLSAYTYPKKSGDDDESLDMTERNSVCSDDNSPNSETSMSPEFEQSPLPDPIAAEPMEDLSLPSKYKSAIKAFVSHLKQKLNTSKNQ